MGSDFLKGNGSSISLIMRKGMKTEQQPLISIVMPLYNAEMFLDEAICCVLSQTFNNFELICIIDGCTDRTEIIVRKYATIDKRVKILINDCKKGAAYSRNVGIKIAKGRYVAFLDGDDIFDEHMLELAIGAALENRTDLILFDAVHSDTEHIHKKRRSSRTDRYLEKYCRTPFSLNENNEIELASQYSTSPWNKLYNLEFIKNNHIYFQDLKNSNDVYFTELNMILSRRTIHLYSEYVLVYARDHKSQSRISFNRDPMCAYLAYKKLIEETKERNLLKKNSRYILLRSYIGIANAISSIKDEKEKSDFLLFLKKNGIDNILELLRDIDIDADIIELLNVYKSNSGLAINYYNLFVEKYICNKYLNNILNLFNNGNKVVMWGCGTYGNIIIRLLEENNISFMDVVDANESIIGNSIGKYRIKYAFSYDFSKADCVLVSTKGISMNVRNELKQCHNLLIVDFCDLVKI